MKIKLLVKRDPKTLKLVRSDYGEKLYQKERKKEKKQK
jgi:hypothetical protein